MKTLALVPIIFLSGCFATTDPPRGVDTTKKLEIDARLLSPPASFSPMPETPLTESVILHEYSSLARAYVGCFNTLTGLQTLLKSSNLVLTVPTFTADLVDKERPIE